MKILHINSNYIFTALHQNMILKLNEHKISNSVFVPVYDSHVKTVEPIKDVEVIECFNKFDRICFGFKQKKIQRALTKFFEVESYDCIHAYTLFTDGNCALRLKKRFNIPYVVAVRNTDVNVFFKYMFHLYKKGIRIMENAEKVFFLSQSYKETVLNKYVPPTIRDVIENKSVIIPNGIDSFWFNNLYLKRDFDETEKRLKKKNVKIIYAGSVDKNKNIELTIKALYKLMNDGWNISYTIIGPVKDKRIYIKYKNVSWITFIEKLPKEELIKYYRDSDVFVMPSHKETFGLVYAEAMSQGLPVIYTRGQGFDMQFPEGVVGYAVNDKDVNSLFEGLKQVFYRYREISMNCLRSVHIFDWDKICKEYIMLYEDVCKEKCKGLK